MASAVHIHFSKGEGSCIGRRQSPEDIHDIILRPEQDNLLTTYGGYVFSFYAIGLLFAIQLLVNLHNTFECY